MKSRESMLNSHLIKLFLAGTILTFAGFLLSYGCPINKKDMVAYLRTGYLRIGFQLPGATHLDYRRERL